MIRSFHGCGGTQPPLLLLGQLVLPRLPGPHQGRLSRRAPSLNMSMRVIMGMRGHSFQGWDRSMPASRRRAWAIA